MTARPAYCTFRAYLGRTPTRPVGAKPALRQAEPFTRGPALPPVSLPPVSLPPVSLPPVSLPPVSLPGLSLLPE